MIFLEYLMRGASLTIWLLVIPYMIGLIPARFISTRYRTPGVILLFGYIVYLAVFELVAIVVTLNVIHGGLSTLLRWVSPLAYLLAGLGIGIEITMPTETGRMARLRRVLPFKMYDFGASWEERIVWLIFGLLVTFQLYMFVTRASFDGDDAFFVAQSLVAWQRDLLFRVEPYTGDSTVLNLRNALSAFPLWIAMIGSKARTHTTIVAHTVMPLVLLPLTYLLFMQIGKVLLASKKALLPVFMVFIAVIQMFGNDSIFTNETFLMTRIWQGKSFAANFIIPAAVWLLLLISSTGNEKRKGMSSDGEEAEGGENDSNVVCGEKSAGKVSETTKTAITGDSSTIYWVMLAILTFTAAIASSLAVLLILILVSISGLCLSVYRRDGSYLFKAAITCVPGLLFILVYLVLTR